jgi:hypothetical protein
MPFDGFVGFDEDALPTASDVVFMLSQYLKSMDKFRYDNTRIDRGRCVWILDEKPATKVTRRSKLHMRA